MLRALAVVLLAGGIAHADDGVILYAREGVLWGQAPKSGATPQELAKLPGKAIAIESNAKGTLVVITLEQGAVWWVPGEDAVRDGGGVCKGRARPSPVGDCVVCPAGDAWKMVALGGEPTHDVPSDLSELGFLGPEPPELTAAIGDEVVAWTRRGDARRTLAKPGEKLGRLIPAPDGTRAVATLGAGEDERVYSFLLDGDGVARRIGGPGYPVQWSWDSTWVLIREGEPPAEHEGDDEGDESAALAKKPKKKPPKKKPVKEQPPPAVRACATRAVGGEAKCWDDYSPVAFSPDSSIILLEKGGALYGGKLAGVHPETPHKLVDGPVEAAAWLPVTLP